AGFVNRYVLLSATGLCAVQLPLGEAARAWSARLARVVLLTATVASIRVNVDYALETGRDRVRTTEHFLERCRAGTDIDELAHETYVSFFYDEHTFAEAVRTLQHGGSLTFLPFGASFPAGVEPLDALRTRPSRITSAERATARQLRRFP